MNSSFQNSINFCGIHFNTLNRESLFSNSGTLKFIVTANASFIVNANKKDHRLHKIISNNWSTFDGQVPLMVARRQYPNHKIEKISGSDLVYDFCRKAQAEDLSIFLLGASRTSNQKAVEKLRAAYGIRIGGYSGPYQKYPFTASSENTIKDELRAFKPDILLVGFGSPKQEYWIEDNYEFLQELGVKFVVGSGGTTDFVAGTIKRAPKMVQKIGLEGLYRLAMQPNIARLVRLGISCQFLRYIGRSRQDMTSPVQKV